MLKHQLIHPKINEVLARAGHHARILIADGNYPASTKKGPVAEVVSLNLSPGIVTVAQVLRAVLSAVPIDQVNTMGIPPDTVPDEYRAKHCLSSLNGLAVQQLGPTLAKLLNEQR